MKTFLKYSTALAIVATSISSVADAKMPMNFKPSTSPIQIKAPIVKVTPRIVDVPVNLGGALRPETLERDDTADAGPQPEPPTDQELGGLQDATDNDKVQVTPVPEPPNITAKDGLKNAQNQSPTRVSRYAPEAAPLPPKRAYNEFEERVPDGLRHMIDITGGNINDLARLKELEEVFAAGAFWQQEPGNPFEDPASMLGHGRFGDGMEGPPIGAGNAPANPGHAASGWRFGYSYQTGDTYGSVWTREGKFGTETWDRSYGPDGMMTVEITSHQLGPNRPVTETIERTERDDYQVTIKYSNGDGDTWTSSSASTDEDANGDGAPDNIEGAENYENDAEVERGENAENESTADPGEKPENGEAGGGSQTGDWDSASGGTGGCGVWTPFNGCSGTGMKAWETTGQPNPTDDGSSDTRNAGASIGPEAVTNSGDGSFEPGGNTGGGGFKLDPCATVSGCGGPGGGTQPGPTNPGA